MKILKNIKLLCALLCIAALYSCDKYLDIQPVGKVIPRTAAEFRALLTQAYSYVPSDRGLATFRSDEMIMDGTLAAEDLNSYKDICESVGKYDGIQLAFVLSYIVYRQLCH